MAASSSSSSANSSSNSTSSIPKLIKFGYTDFKVLSDAKPPKRIAGWKFCTSEKIFINDSIIELITWTWSHPLTEMKLLLRISIARKKSTCFLVRFSREYIFSIHFITKLFMMKEIFGLNKMLILMVYGTILTKKTSPTTDLSLIFLSYLNLLHEHVVKNSLTTHLYK